MSFYGLARQTYQDFEIIFTDARYHLRHSRVMDAWAKACGETGCKAPLYHVPNHRTQPPPWGTTCAGYNSGFLLSVGPLVVMLCDYAYCPPGWLAAHVAAHATKRLVMAPHGYTQLPPVVTLDGKPPLAWDGDRPEGMGPEDLLAERERYDEISIFEKSFEPSMLGAPLQYPHCDVKMTMPEGPAGEGYFHTKNESFPLANALAVNGMDEHYDRMRGPGDPELAGRLIRSGLEGWIAPAAVVHVPNPRWILPNPNAASYYDKPTPNHEWRGDYLKGERYYFESQREGRIVAPNPFKMWVRWTEIWHWRELSQSRDILIPENLVTDADYFRV